MRKFALSGQEKAKRHHHITNYISNQESLIVKNLKEKKQPDNDYTNERKDGGIALSKDEFVEALDKVISKKISPSEGKSKTSE